jgi:hypothetical protein
VRARALADGAFEAHGDRGVAKLVVVDQSGGVAPRGGLAGGRLAAATRRATAAEPPLTSAIGRRCQRLQLSVVAAIFETLLARFALTLDALRTRPMAVTTDAPPAPMAPLSAGSQGLAHRGDCASLE